MRTWALVACLGSIGCSGTKVDDGDTDQVLDTDPYVPTGNFEHSDDTDLRETDPDDTDDRRPTGWVEEAFTSGAADLDLLWVVDVGGTTDDERGRLDDASSALVTRLSGLEGSWHLGVVGCGVTGAGTDGTLTGDVIDGSTPSPAATFMTRVDAAAACPEGRAILDATLLAVTEPRVSTANAGFLRADALLAVVAWTDGDDASEDAVSDYVTAFGGLKPVAEMVSFSALAGPAAASCSDAAAAPRLHEMIEETAGAYGDYCADRWDGFLSEVGGIGDATQRVYRLGAAPTSSANVRVFVRGGEAILDDRNGFVWDDERRAVVLQGNAVPRVGRDVVVWYEPR